MNPGLLFFLCVLVLPASTVESKASKRKKYGCILPPEPIFGHFKFKAKFKKITYVCDKGYELTGMRYDYRYCKKGKWDGSHGDCTVPYYMLRRCQKPEAPKHGEVDFYKIEKGKGFEAEFSCDRGYKRVGARKLRCKDKNTWTGGSFPICRSLKTVEDLTNILKEDFINPLAANTADSEDNGVNGKLLVGATGLDIIFLLDTSASIGEKSLQTAKKFINIIVEQFGVSNMTSGGTNGTRVAFITFSSKAEVVFNLDDPKIRSTEAVKQAINATVSAGGGTDLNDALSKVLNIAFKLNMGAEKKRFKHSSKAIFIVTDARATFNSTKGTLERQKIKSVSKNLIKRNFEIFAIGIGGNVDLKVLKEIASHPKDEHVFMTDNFDNLDRVRDIIAEQNIDYGQCGISGNIEVQQRASKAKKGAWPWVVWVSVMILQDEETGSPDRAWTCGGALLCNRWLLTVAHCVSYRDTINGTLHPADAKTMNVHLGDHNLYDKKSPHVTVPVKNVLIHPKYTGEEVTEHMVKEYDVALLDLGENPPYQLGKFIRPVCYPTQVKKDKDDTDVYKISDVRLKKMQRNKLNGFIAGWGHAPINVNLTQFPWDSLYQDRRPLLPHKTCQKRFPDLNENLFFCVFNSWGESDYCRGDVGGPLVEEMANDRFTVLGLAAKTHDCKKGDSSFSIFQNVVNPEISDWVGGHLDGCNRVKEDPTWSERMKNKTKEREKERADKIAEEKERAAEENDKKENSADEDEEKEKADLGENDQNANKQNNNRRKKNRNGMNGRMKGKGNGKKKGKKKKGKEEKKKKINMKNGNGLNEIDENVNGMN